MKKRLLAVILAAAISVTGAMPAMAAQTQPEIRTEISEETPESTPELKEGWNTVDGKKYFVKNGVVKKGWLTYKGSKYYLNPADGGAAATGITKIKKHAYFFEKSGKMLKSKYAYKIGKHYYAANRKGILTKLSPVAALAGMKLDELKGSLPAAFRWASKIPYKDVVVPAGKNKAKFYGEYAFRNRVGDCNVQAYAFYWMAKVLGYDVKVVKGFIPTAVDANKNPTKFGAHAWCEIKSGKKTLVCDPNFAAYHKGGYKFTYNQPGHYRYYDKNKKLISKK